MFRSEERKKVYLCARIPFEELYFRVVANLCHRLDDVGIVRSCREMIESVGCRFVIYRSRRV